MQCLLHHNKDKNTLECPRIDCSCSFTILSFTCSFYILHTHILHVHFFLFPFVSNRSFSSLSPFSAFTLSSLFSFPFSSLSFIICFCSLFRLHLCSSVLHVIVPSVPYILYCTLRIIIPCVSRIPCYYVIHVVNAALVSFAITIIAIVPSSFYDILSEYLSSLNIIFTSIIFLNDECFYALYSAPALYTVVSYLTPLTALHNRSDRRLIPKADKILTAALKTSNR